MKKTAQVICLGLSITALSSCTSFYQTMGYYNDSYGYDRQESYYSEDTNQQSYDYRGQQWQTRKPVRVPNSYHVGEHHSPESHKSRDRSWVNSQNPMGYTIEVADDETPASVAEQLQKAPKNDRKAQVKYRKDGKTHYKGVYGTYNNYQDAKKAMSNLPEDVRNKARVKNWGNVQGKINNE